MPPSTANSSSSLRNLRIAVHVPTENDIKNKKNPTKDPKLDQILPVELTTNDDNQKCYACPFCRWKCHTQHCTEFDSFHRHLARFHADTFAFDFELLSRSSSNNNNHNTILATLRNEHYQPGRLADPQHVFLHSRSHIPLEQGQYDRDSDDESTYSWQAAYRQERLEENSTLSPKEKQFFTLWNSFMLDYQNNNNKNGDGGAWKPALCIDFIRRHTTELRDLEPQVYLWLIRLWECRKISGVQFQKLVYLYEQEVVVGDKGGNKKGRTKRGQH
jgi:VEFS-Box of polycomb protein